MIKEKENARKDYINMIKNAWTVDKMTNEEWNKLLDIFYNTQTSEVLKGTYDQRWKVLQAIFTSYLIGLGYTPDWREDQPSTSKYFVREGFY